MSEPIDELYSGWAGPRDGFLSCTGHKRACVGDTSPPLPQSELNAIETVYRKVGLTDKQIRPIMAGLHAVSAPDRRLIAFDCDAFHQATKAVGNGWRWFGRVSRNTERAKTVTNEIRRQVQVYLEYPMEGW